MATSVNLIFSKFKVNRLSLSFITIIALFLVFGTLTVNGLFTLGNLTKTIYEHPLVVSNASLIAALNITKMHRDMKDVVLALTPVERDNVLDKVARNERIVYEQLDIIKDKILGQQGQMLEKQTRQIFMDWPPIRNEVVNLLKVGDKGAAIAITKAKGADHVAELESKMLALTSYARKKADNFIGLAESNQTRLENITIFLTSVGVALSTLIAVVTTYFVITNQRKLKENNQKLKEALARIKTLHGIIPICANCKKIRDDQGSWKQLEEYIQKHSDAEFSHGICPNCMQNLYPEYFEELHSSHSDQDKKK